MRHAPAFASLTDFRRRSARGAPRAGCSPWLAGPLSALVLLLLATPAGAAPAAGALVGPQGPHGEPRLVDQGLWPDLNARVRLDPPAWLVPSEVDLLLSLRRATLSVRVAGEAVSTYPVLLAAAPAPGRFPVRFCEAPGGAGAALCLGRGHLVLTQADAAELRPAVAAGASVEVLDPARPDPTDRDDDGIPDTVDVARGARKTALNGARYTEGYHTLRYPGGDVPRAIGVCTDVVVRAVRNAGLDLQVAVHEDIVRNRAVYGARVRKPNPSIDQRRVKTIVVYFRRHWRAIDAPATAAAAAEWRAGDVVFFDTFPSRPGPDHVGVVSDRLGPRGLPLVTNNWTNGFTTGDMDLLGLVEVTDHFRIPSGRALPARAAGAPHRTSAD